MRAAKSLNQAQAGGPIGHGGDSFSAGSTVALSGPGHAVGAHPTRWAPSYVGLITGRLYAVVGGRHRRGVAAKRDRKSERRRKIRVQLDERVNPRFRLWREFRISDGGDLHMTPIPPGSDGCRPMKDQYRKKPCDAIQRAQGQTRHRQQQRLHLSASRRRRDTPQDRREGWPLFRISGHSTSIAPGDRC